MSEAFGPALDYPKSTGLVDICQPVSVWHFPSLDPGTGFKTAGDYEALKSTLLRTDSWRMACCASPGLPRLTRAESIGAVQLHFTLTADGLGFGNRCVEAEPATRFPRSRKLH